MEKELKLTNLEKQVRSTLRKQEFFIDTLDNTIVNIIPLPENASLRLSLKETYKFLKNIAAEQRQKHLDIIEKSASCVVLNHKNFGKVNKIPALIHEINQLERWNFWRITDLNEVFEKPVKRFENKLKKEKLTYEW